MKSLGLLLGTALYLCFFSCSLDPKKESQTKLNSKYIKNHTKGVISRDSKINILFSKQLAINVPLNKVLDSALLTFSPKIEGSTVFTDKSHLVFYPLTPLANDTKYTAYLNLSKVDSKIPPSSLFTFSFSTPKQAFEIIIGELKSAETNSLKKQILSGKLNTMNQEEALTVEKLLTAKQGEKFLSIKWQHAQGGREHQFFINGIEKKIHPSMIQLSWDGKAIGTLQKGKRSISVSPLNVFILADVQVKSQGSQYLKLRFTDPLDPHQNLNGLITLNDQRPLKFSIRRNIVRVYSDRPWLSTMTLKVYTGIKNVIGVTLSEPQQHTLVFKDLKPVVRFVTKGNIVPSHARLTIPIETMNLKKVRISATKVFSNNMQQFFQVNTHDSHGEMRRVGKIVWKKTIELPESTKTRNRWVRSGLDLTPLTDKFPGGMYQLKLSFILPHINYPCWGVDIDNWEDDWDRREDDGPLNLSNWDNISDQEVYSWAYYQQRKNPCHPAFYRHYGDHHIEVQKNIWISNLGITAKASDVGTLYVTVTHLKTALPIQGARVKIFNYQQQELGQGLTDEAGFAKIDNIKSPYLMEVIGSKTDPANKAYMRLDDGRSLPMSQFNIVGKQVNKGLKGFFYGERGVWRPGDTLFMNFILFDEQKKIPETHPVTFLLIDPRNKITHKKVVTQSIGGFYPFQTSTSLDAPTGRWTLKAEVGGVQFEKKIKIETVVPNRLKLKFRLTGEPSLITSHNIEGELSAKWLHGAIARNLKAKMSVKLIPITTTFTGLESYTFDDPVRKFKSSWFDFYEGKLNQKGDASWKMNFNVKGYSPGMLKALFNTTVFEPSGAFSVDQFSIPYSPYSHYVGLLLPKGDKTRGMLLTDKDHRVEILRVNARGERVDGEVDIEVYKIKWRWWWEKGHESIGDYLGTTSYQPIQRSRVAIKDGRGLWHLKIKYPDWGRYLVRIKDKNGHHMAGKIVYIDWPGWAGRGQKESGGSASIINFQVERDKYNIGEEVKVTIPSSKGSRALVSIESSGRVIQQEWVEDKGDQKGKGSLIYRFKALPIMTPNIYVHVSLIQPYQQSENDLPIRMYGIVPVPINDPSTHLNPIIKLPDVLTPGELAKIDVGEESGRPMSYTLALVDEGLLDLTRFKTPDPWSYFYQREALTIKTWDLYDFVAGAYGGTLEQVLAIGGDGSAESSSTSGSKKASRFPPMVKFLGPVKLGPNEIQSHAIKIPEYIGSVRAMVVAGANGAFGKAEKSVFVKKPLMVLGTLPRSMNMGDEVVMPVTVFALDDAMGRVTVEIQNNSLVEFMTPANSEIIFKNRGEQELLFKLRAGNKEGIENLKIKAYVKDNKAIGQAFHSIEIDVKNPFKRMIATYPLTMPAGEFVENQITLPGAIGERDIWLELSRFPQLKIGHRIDYLLNYPHGCLEQTISGAFPQLLLSQLLQLSPAKEKKAENQIKEILHHLTSFQQEGGGFSLWPGHYPANEWVTNYVGHFLMVAKQKGYDVPFDLIQGWASFQKKKAFAWVAGSPQSELVQAYRLFTLVLAGEVDLGSMNRLKEVLHLPVNAKWRLAIAYQLAGQPEAAKSITAGLSFSIPDYREQSNTFGTALRDRAMIAESLCLMGLREKAQLLLDDIHNKLGGDSSLNTQELGFALLAIATCSSSKKADFLSFSYGWETASKQVTLQNDNVIEVVPETDQPKSRFVVKNNSKVPLYGHLKIASTPQLDSSKVHVKGCQGKDNGLKVDIHYSKVLGEKEEPLALKSGLAQGTDFKAYITVKNTGPTGKYEEVALSFIIPSGWEIRNERMNLIKQINHSEHGYTYQDVRDDRIYTYFDLDHQEEKTFQIKLNATYQGSFFGPIIHAETMYDPSINSCSIGGWQTIHSGAI